MADPIVLGQVSIISRGAWASGTAYNPLDLVGNVGGTFLCKQANTGVQPGVTSGWANYWVSAAKGIRSVAVSNSNGTVSVVFTFSDGTTYTGTYPSTTVAENSVTNAMLQQNSVATGNIRDGAVTADKLDSSLTYTAVNLNANQVTPIKSGTAVPTTSTLADGEIYLKYS